MICSHCDFKDARIARLERELGIRRHDNEIAALMHRLEVSPTHARLLLRLYAANGKVVAKETLMGVLSTASEPTLKTTICRMRHLLGAEIINTDLTLGYHMTPVGLSMVLAALEPVALQEIREPSADVSDLV